MAGIVPLAAVAATAPSVNTIDRTNELTISVESTSWQTAQLDPTDPMAPAPEELLFSAEPQAAASTTAGAEVLGQAGLNQNLPDPARGTIQTGSVEFQPGQPPIAAAEADGEAVSEPLEFGPTTSTAIGQTQPSSNSNPIIRADNQIFPATPPITSAPPFAPITSSTPTTVSKTVRPTSQTNTTRTTNPTTTTRRTTLGTTTAPSSTTAPTTATTRPAATTTTKPPVTTTTTAPPNPAGPTLVWQDNFDVLDSHVWRKEHSTYGDGNNELQCYRPENVSVSGGKLILRAKAETYTCPNGSTRQATSGMVRSQGVLYKPGQRIEFRIKINPADANDQRGLWPALWASSWNGGGWPRGGEFDWLEYVGTTPTRSNHAIHWQDTSGRHKHSSKAVDHGVKFSDGWHTITFDWGQELVWYVDGQEVQRINPTLLNAANNPFLKSAKPVSQLKINFALGGNWPGPLGPTTIDAAGNTTFEVDYVRIYDLP